ncbi:MAG: alpha-galactosidase [Treponema sp.]|nr:alpha-galactosidase [Treponema sp.]
MAFAIDGVITAPFETDGIGFKGGNPYCVILTGKEEKPVKISLELSRAAKREYRDQCFTGAIAEQVYTVRQGDYGFTWRIGFLEGRRGLRVGASFENHGAEPVRLKEFCLLDGTLSYEGAGGEWWLSAMQADLRTGTLADVLQSRNEETIEAWKGFKRPVPEGAVKDEPRYTDGRYRSYTDFLTLYRDEGVRGAIFGAVGKPEADITYDLKVNEHDVDFAALSSMTEILVEPGQTRNAQEMAILFGDSRPGIETILRWNAAFLGARTHRKALVGWCSWYYYYNEITEETVMATINGFKALKETVPVDVIQIDDGYQKHYGDWECNERFPHGFEPWIRGIRDAGAMPGIWLAPLSVHDETGLLREHPEWSQKDRSGHLFGNLDPTHPGARAFIRDIIRRKKAQGFTYYKIDFNGLSPDCRYTDPYKTRLQVYRDLYALYREELGEECYLLACAGLQRATAGYADASRIATDSCDAWVNAHPCSISNAIRGLGTNAAANGIFYVNDPDVTYLTAEDSPRKRRLTGSTVTDNQKRRITEDERRTWHGFVGLLGGLQLTSDPVEDEPYASSIRQLEILSPPAREKGQPLCPAAERDHTSFGFAAKRPWGDFASLMLWNNKDGPGAKTFPRREFGPAGILGFLGDRFHVWSFWDAAYQGICGRDYSTGELPAHGSRLLRLSPLAEDRPVIVGSTLHISMGAAEIADVLYGKNSLTIRLKPQAGARTGSLFVYSLKPLSCERAEGLKAGPIGSAGGVYEIPLSNRDRQASCQELRLRIQ